MSNGCKHWKMKGIITACSMRSHVRSLSSLIFRGSGINFCLYLFSWKIQAIKCAWRWHRFLDMRKKWTIQGTFTALITIISEYAWLITEVLLSLFYRQGTEPQETEIQLFKVISGLKEQITVIVKHQHIWMIWECDLSIADFLRLFLV